MRIALVDDDFHLAQIITLWLKARGYAVMHFISGLDFTNALRKDSFDLYILDWVMPDMDGEAVLKWLIEQNDHTTPVIFVTQRDSEEDVARILNLGADDYITKPIREKELLARIAAVTRRSHTPATLQREILEYPPFRVNTTAHIVTKDNETLKLTQKEYELVAFLFKNAGRLLSRGHILSAVWGHGTDFTTRTVDTHISRVRKKLELTPESGWRLSAIYHQGYRLEPVDKDESTPLT
ncbi:MAG: response regulator transcription factor [Gammaproteobacteria bacterium]|nr:response regulator transcription factor [Gammaproteobacteria bacterium]